MVFQLAYRCEIGYRKREGHPSRFGSRTGHESCPFIRLLSVRSIEIDTGLGEISMTLVMTMSVEYLAVAKGISSPLTLWDNMIDFPDISILEDESTEATFPLLIFQERCQFPFNQWVMGESLTPIQKIAIIWACPPSHLGVIPDRGLAVRSQFCALFGSKDPMAFLFRSPVVLDKPFLSSGGMFAPGPLHELEIQDMVTPGERSGRADCSIVVSPSTNDWIEFLDKSLLGVSNVN